MLCSCCRCALKLADANISDANATVTNVTSIELQGNESLTLNMSATKLHTVDPVVEFWQ